MAVRELTSEEIKQGLDSYDKDIVDGFLSGEIVEKKPEAVQEQTEKAQQASENTFTPPQEDAVEQTEEDRQAEEEALRKEREEQAKYEEFLRKQQEEEERKKEREELLRREAKEKQRADEERKAREELEKRLRQLEEQQSQRRESPATPADTEQDPDEEYASEYSRRTRQELEALKKNFNPEKFSLVEERLNRLNEIEEKIRKQEEERDRRAAEEEQKRQQQRFYKEVDEFSSRIPELKLSKPSEQADAEYTRFRRDIGNLIKNHNPEAVDNAISKLYTDEASPIRSQVEANGIPVPEELDKLSQLKDVVDYMNGKRYNPVTGRMETITNKLTGEPVRLPSLEEAYYLMTRQQREKEANRRAFKQVQQKMDHLQSGAVTLDNATTQAPEAEMSTAEAMHYMTMSKDQAWMSVPRNQELARKAWAKVGM